MYNRILSMLEKKGGLVMACNDIEAIVVDGVRYDRVTASGIDKTCKECDLRHRCNSIDSVFSLSCSYLSKNNECWKLHNER